MSANLRGASPRKRTPAFKISPTASNWYGTEAITKSGFERKIACAFAVHESGTTARDPSATSGHTSAQYFVHATTRSSRPRSRMVNVALGCRQATRWGGKFDIIPEFDYMNRRELGAALEMR